MDGDTPKGTVGLCQKMVDEFLTDMLSTGLWGYGQIVDIHAGGGMW